MYLAITNRCNMTCEHCCMACTAKGSNMSEKHFRQALQVARDYDEYLVLGGGEPTLHPKFELFLILAIAESDGEDNRPTIITNGKLRARAMLIADLTQGKVLHGELSQDPYHDPIDAAVVAAFAKLNAIRDVTRGETQRPSIIAGREMLSRGLTRREAVRRYPSESCPCDEVFVRPNGKIYQCGCPDSPQIGHVETGYNSPCQGVCFRSDEYQEAKRETENARRREEQRQETEAA